MSSQSGSIGPPSVDLGLSVPFDCFSFEVMTTGFCEVDIKGKTVAKAETGWPLWKVSVSTKLMGKWWESTNHQFTAVLLAII